ncbi:AraC family transcriptional regulator [Niallia nealsonii]|uniref:AraC family transcriptional regulator n=1 Tax=Niallia nealsonii TaxID=115979 RepID=A0A2N0Z5S2_9BACI|nr:helix-turn-helix domain-containing protein [Niallia nealsonii]PKG24868.1 AraC family transcriptional regulator [Niallia nealsonii]
MKGKSNIIFTPSQPELKFSSQNYIEYCPQNLIRSEVSLFYQFTIDRHDEGFLQVIPDGCFDLLFCTHPIHPFAVIASSPNQRCIYNFQPDCEYFAVRFYPEQNSLPFAIPLKELIQQQQVPLFDVVNLPSFLLEKIASFPNFQERVKWFQHFLHTIQQKSDYTHNLVSHCIKKIYSSNGAINIKELSTETGYSDRYIRKKFEETIGFSPKNFSQIVRLQYSINEILNVTSPMEDKMDYGFFDQSHFYKNFKKHMALTPKQFREKFYMEK